MKLRLYNSGFVAGLLTTAMVLFSQIAVLAADSLPAGLSRDGLRAEIMRRRAVLMLADGQEPESLLRALEHAPDEYRKLAGEFLVFYRNVLQQVYVNDERLALMLELHEYRERLRRDAERQGILVSPEVAANVRNGDPKGKVFGVPKEAMTFDPATAQVADQYREMQWTLFDTYENAVRDYEKKYGEEYCTQINSVLDRRYNLLSDYRKEHEARQEQLRRLVVANTHDAWLGTHAVANVAPLRSPTFRVKPEELPGVEIGLPVIQRYRLPSQVRAPAKPEPLVFKWDGQKLLELKLAADKEHVRADEQMLLLKKLYPALKVYDVLRTIASAPGQPFVQSFANEDWTASQAMVASLAGYGKMMTWDTVTGVYGAAERTLGRAVAVDEGITQSIDTLKNILTIAQTDGEMLGTLGGMLLDSPQTPDEKLAYLEKLQDYRQKIETSEQAQESLNEKVDKVSDAAVDALVLYMTGKGIQRKVEAFKTPPRGQQFLQYKETLKKRAEITKQAADLLADRKFVRENPEVAKCAREFIENQKNLQSVHKTKIKAEKKMADAATKLRNKKQSAVDAELDSIFKKKTVPVKEAGQVVRTSTGAEIKLGKQLGSGTFGDVYELPDGSVVKLFQRDVLGINKLKHQGREAMLSESMAKDGVPMAKVLTKGTLDDGTPFLVKEKINSAALLENVPKTATGKLPVECQKALLDLVADTNGKGYFLGDVNAGNVYFQKLPDGTLKAKFLEVDFSKKINFANDPFIKTPEQLAALQKTQMLKTGNIPLEEVMRSTTGEGGSAGSLKGMLDDGMVEAYTDNAVQKIKASVAEGKLQSALDDFGTIAKALDDAVKSSADDSVGAGAIPNLLDDSSMSKNTTPTLNLADEMGKVSSDIQALELPPGWGQTVDPGSLLEGFDIKLDLPKLE